MPLVRFCFRFRFRFLVARVAVLVAFAVLLPCAIRSAPAQEQAAARMFENQVAPLLAQHCLECHDTTTRKGGLDLSRKAAAQAGGEGGPVIVAGKSQDSPLWKHVAADEMPADRPPLSAEQKQVLKQWIDGGAAWTLDFIDPIVYAHEQHATVNWIRRLTVEEYIETVRSTVGVDIAKEAREILPPDLRADGFSNTAYNLNVDLPHVEAYSRLAGIIVGRMDVVKFAGKFSKSRSLSTDDTLRDLVAQMGKSVLRGPLDDREVTNFSGIATTVASAGGNFKDAMQYTLQAMLQSPRFIYRIEKQIGEGSVWAPSPYELAARMSYIVWGGPPDEALLQAADKGELADRQQVEAQLQRMLKDPRAIARSQRFLYEWLDLGRLENLQPDAAKFPGWNAELAHDMRSETLAFFKDLIWDQQRPLAELFNAQFTYATPRLARHYGLEPKGDELARYDLGSVPSRGGLLTQGSILTIGGDEASMVTRGLFLLHEFLRGAVKDPPPCVDTTPPSTKPGLTQRGISEGRVANANCGGCHGKFEPLAFGLEKFDGLGVFRAQDDHGNPLRDDGQVLVPGSAEPVAYKNSRELMDLLASSERVRESITWKLTQFALGRPLGPQDAALLADIHQKAQQGGGTYSSTLTAIVLSDLVQKTRKEHSE
jgi:mono/diheme cytochrome c family protein